MQALVCAFYCDLAWMLACLLLLRVGGQWVIVGSKVVKVFGLLASLPAWSLALKPHSCMPIRNRLAIHVCTPMRTSLACTWEPDLHAHRT